AGSEGFEYGSPMLCLSVNWAGSSGRNGQGLNIVVGEAPLELGGDVGRARLVGPDDHRRARAREGGAERALGEVVADRRKVRRMLGPVGLVQAVVGARREHGGVPARERRTE